MNTNTAATLNAKAEAFDAKGRLDVGRWYRLLASLHVKPLACNAGHGDLLPHPVNFDMFQCRTCGFVHVVEPPEPLRPGPVQDEHTKDEDCTVDPVTLSCTVCGVMHWEPCPKCGGRGFHRAGCEDLDDAVQA